MAQLRVQSLPRPQLMAAGLVIGSLDDKAFSRATWLPWARLIISLQETNEKGLELVPRP